MTRLARGLIFAGVAVFAVSAYAASGDTAAVPASGATESIPPANQPAQPAVPPPGGFPVIVVPLAIAVGAVVGLATDENDSVNLPTGTATATGTM